MNMGKLKAYGRSVKGFLIVMGMGISLRVAFLLSGNFVCINQ